MSDVIVLADYRVLADCRHHSTPIYFDRAELARLLSLYSRMVADGVWRDYAIDQQPRLATFSVFRHAAAVPAFTIAKFPAGTRPGGDYLLTAGARKIKESASIDDLLATFEVGLPAA